jgi:hypothetical protein
VTSSGHVHWSTRDILFNPERKAAAAALQRAMEHEKKSD